MTIKPNQPWRGAWSRKTGKLSKPRPVTIKNGPQFLVIHTALQAVIFDANETIEVINHNADELKIMNKEIDRELALASNAINILWRAQSDD